MFLSIARREGGSGLAAVFAFEIARFACEDQEKRQERPAAPPAESVRSKPSPLIQLQLAASFQEGKVQLTGIISNYGREQASDVRVVLPERKAPLMSYQTLAVQERHDEDLIVSDEILPKDRIVVSFRFGSETLRQDGAFEAVVGQPHALLFKGLGSAVIAKT